MVFPDPQNPAFWRIFNQNDPQKINWCVLDYATKKQESKFSDSFTILGLWVLGLTVSHINESNCKLMSPEHYFQDKSAVPLHPGTR